MSLIKSLERLKYFNFDPKNILDIGAHKGVWTRDVRKVFPYANYLLMDATEYDELKNSGEKYIIAILNNENVEVDWYTNHSSGDSIFKENSQHYTNIEAIKKQSVKLDDLVDPIYELIKIDCQGAEINIMKGGVETFNKATAVLLELPFCGEYNKNVPSLLEHIAFMETIGYIPFDIPEYHYLYDQVLIQIDILFIKKDSTIMEHIQTMIHYSGQFIYKPPVAISKNIKGLHNIKISNGDRSDIINYIKNEKSKGKFTVIDIGGSMSGWSAPVVDAIVDFLPHKSTDILFFQCDITHPDSWQPILDYVEKNGKFSFSICTHTLEDVMNPGYVCEQISKISEGGYIAVPSKYKELSRHVDSASCEYRGYIHHRWIFTIKDNEFIGYPKINVIDYMGEFDKIASNDVNKQDLSFYWKDQIKIKYINDNYLGPSLNAVLNYYKTLADV